MSDDRHHMILEDDFEQGRRVAAHRQCNAADCPIPLVAVQRRAAWLDGFEMGRREARAVR